MIFTGARPSGLVKRFINKAVEQPAPPPKISGSADPVQRLVQARRHLAKGRAFEAYVLLDNFPDGPEKRNGRSAAACRQFSF